MKLSPALSTLLHIVWSGLFGLIIAGGTAAVQYNATNGINFGQDGIIFATVVLTGLGSTLIAIWSNIQKSPALPLAESEVQAAITQEVRDLASGVHTHIDSVVSWLDAQLQKPQTQQASQSVNTPSAFKPTVLQPLPATNTPVVAQITPNVMPSGAVPLTTVPGMPVVTPQA